MDTIPRRTKIAHLYRDVLDRYEDKIPLPMRDPNYYQVVSIVLSMGYLLLTNTVFKGFFIAVILILDWMDGAAARRYSKPSRKGWMIDVFVDRISEGLIFAAEFFTPIGRIFFTLYLVNIVLSLVSVKTGKHFILALRFYFLIFLILLLL